MRTSFIKIDGGSLVSTSTPRLASSPKAFLAHSLRSAEYVYEVERLAAGEISARVASVRSHSNSDQRSCVGRLVYWIGDTERLSRGVYSDGAEYRSCFRF